MLNKHLVLHLSLIEGIGSTTIQNIVKLMRSDVNSSDLYLFSATDWMYYYGVKEGASQKIVAGLADKKMLETELSLIEKHAIQWVTLLDDSYPALLREIYMPPAVIYWRGGKFGESSSAKNSKDMSPEMSFDIKFVSVVGSRDFNAYGARVVTTIVPELVAAGITIVSGGARGIDTIAHETTLKHGGKTIAVLGSGLLQEYPASNKKLFKAIADTGGLVVSIFPLRFEPLPGNFPARNRVIAGLSHGCLVVQAAQKSGSLITAHYALEQGREVFAVPGPIDDPLSVGCNALIQQGAQLVACSKDIIQQIGGNYNIIRDVQTTLHEAQQLAQQPSASLPEISEIQKKIVAACKKAASLDDILQETGLEMTAVQAELFDMQLEGLVEQDFIGMWVVSR